MSLKTENLFARMHRDVIAILSIACVVKKQILTFFLILNGYFIHAQINELNSQPKVTWDFPVNPSTTEWKELKSFEEQLLAYNIPEELMKKISTPELVKICLTYPKWGVINAFNDRRVGLNNILPQFNGFRELFAQNDAAKELIKVYSKLDPLAISKE